MPVSAPKQDIGEILREFNEQIQKSTNDTEKLQTLISDFEERVKGTSCSFGIGSFPDNPSKGDLFIRVDFSPNKIFQFNGKDWIEKRR